MGKALLLNNPHIEMGNWYRHAITVSEFVGLPFHQPSAQLHILSFLNVT
jgi:hypothetical protein